MSSVQHGSSGPERNAFVPERLREAREARGYSMAELGAKVGLTRQAISKFELGQATPSNIFELARTLEFPLAYFSLPIQKADRPLSAIYFRRLKSASLKSRGLCRVRTHWLSQIVNLLEDHVDFPELLLPELAEAGEPWNYEAYTNHQIEEAAYLCRALWKIPEGPISDVGLACENNGIIISQIKLGVDAVDAFSLWFGDRPLIFLASDKKSAVRSRFDTAHELGHLVLHTGLSDDDINDATILKRIETEANKFAAALLMPKEAFEAEFISRRMDHLIELKRRWKVSIAALVFRARELDLISEDEVLNLRKTLSFYGYNKAEPLDDEIPFEEPRLLRRAMNLVLEGGVISKDELFGTFRLPPAEIEKLCFLPENSLSVPGKIAELEVRLRDSRQNDLFARN